jgi:hypothetical protein
MPKRSTERERFYHYMLSDAIRAIGYWATVYNDVTVADSLQSYDVDETGDDDESPVTLGTVNIGTIAKGWQALVKLETEGKFWHCGISDSVRRAERALTEANGDEDYDACVCDAVIQLGTIGEVRYG